MVPLDPSTGVWLYMVIPLWHVLYMIDTHFILLSRPNVQVTL